MPKLIRFLLIITCLHLVLFSLLRVAFWQYFHDPLDPLTLNDLGTAFYLGMKFDLQLSLLIILPIFIIGNIRIFNPFNSGGMRFLWLAYFFFVLISILIIYTGNFGHYGYLDKLHDATVLRFLENPDISTQMVWETYPVIPWALGFITFMTLYLFIVNRLIIRDSYLLDSQRGFFKKLVIATVFSSLMILGLFGKISYYPLRWSDAFFSPHNFVPAVTSNPVLYFINTFKNRKVNYSDTETRKYYDLMSNYLNVDLPNKVALNYVRTIPAKNNLTKTNTKLNAKINAKLNSGKKFNVVMVFLESFSAFKSGLYNNPLNPTPNIDAPCEKRLFLQPFLYS